jgi:hypothetical protein
LGEIEWLRAGLASKKGAFDIPKTNSLVGALPFQKKYARLLQFVLFRYGLNDNFCFFLFIIFLQTNRLVG